MQLRALSQLNFRNLRTPRIEFAAGITAVVGRNAAGKSNLLEAAYLGCSGDLPQGTIFEAVHHEEKEAYVSAQVERADGIIRTQIGLAPGKKLLRLDNQIVRSYDLARVSAAVLITPEDAALIHGSPAGRRHYLDSLLSRLSLRYAMLLREYYKVVEQRNAALKHADPTLEVWSARFSELGNELARLRSRALGKISTIARDSYQEIARDGKTLSLALTGHSEDLAQALRDTQLEERARGVTVVGPHRSDVAVALDGYSVQAYGSRGEARTASLALRVAEYQLLEEKHKEAPVLLLDDFTAELDAGRREFLLSLASRVPQAIVSGTEAPPKAAHSYKVVEGELHGS